MEIPAYVRKILETLHGAGHEAWCVGGCVRDAMLDRTPEDWDVTTSALPEETASLFPGRAIPTGLRHGTVTVRWEHQSVEVTTYRLDGPYLDHRRPESVAFTSSLEADLARRDFTVNAMALGLNGELRDPFGGQADLEAGVLRCVGEPERRFQEDALRILRGMRFSAALGLREDEATAQAMEEHRDLLLDIAAERIQVELMKLLCGREAAAVLDRHPRILGVFWPEVLPMVGFDQRNKHHCFDVWTHSTAALANTPPEPALRCAALLHDVGKPSTFTLGPDGVGHFYGHGAVSRDLSDRMLRRLKCATEFRETVVRLVEWHDRDIPRTDKSIRKALRSLGERDLRRLILLKRADNLAQAPAYRDRQLEQDKAEAILERLLTEDACFSLQQMAVDGNDMLRLGLKGPAIGRVLNALLDQVVNGELRNERGLLLEEARRRAELEAAQ